MVGWNNCTPQRYMIQLFGILPKHVYNSLVIVWIGTSIQVTDYRCKVILCIGIPADIFTNHIPFKMETLKCMYLSFYQYIILLFAVSPPPPNSPSHFIFLLLPLCCGGVDWLRIWAKPWNMAPCLAMVISTIWPDLTRNWAALHTNRGRKEN